MKPTCNAKKTEPGVIGRHRCNRVKGHKGWHRCGVKWDDGNGPCTYRWRRKEAKS